jgi:hypothetical protein
VNRLTCGYNGGKKIDGRKRHIVTDTRRLLPVTAVSMRWLSLTSTVKLLTILWLWSV